MSSQTDTPITLLAGEAMATAFVRVKANGRTAYLADAVDAGVGTLQAPVASGANCTVRRDTQGSSKMICNAAIVAGAKVYAAASGKIAPSGSKIVGTALDAGTGNNSVIEVLPHPGVNQSSSSSSSSSS